jgi:hypothetical protein
MGKPFSRWNPQNGVVFTVATGRIVGHKRVLGDYSCDVGVHSTTLPVKVGRWSPDTNGVSQEESLAVSGRP